jgi:PAS domain S-box-containing protein
MVRLGAPGLSAISTILKCAVFCISNIHARFGGRLRVKAHISGILRRVTPFTALRGTLATDQMARMLHVLLASILVWIAAVFFATIPFAPVSFPRIFNTFVLEAMYAIALVLLRFGHFRRASLAYLAGTWIWATLVCYSFGGVSSPGALLYVSLPASAAWLLGSAAANWTAGTCISSALVFMVLEIAHLIPPPRHATALGIWAMIVQAIVINAIPVGQIIGRLRESQRRLVSIYNTVEDIIFHLAIEPEGQYRFISVNPAFLRLTGLRQEQVVGKNANEVIPKPALPMVLENYRLAIEEKTVVRWEETSDFPTGRMTGQVSVAPVFDNAGTCTHLVGSVHDITAIRRAQEIEKRLASDLAVSRDEIRALAARLMRAQDEERRRISRDLHDHICHQLSYVAHDVERLLDGPQPLENAHGQLAAIRTRVVRTSQEAHQIAYHMRISILDDLGLVASLKDLCNRFTEQYPDIVVDFEDSGVLSSMQSEVACCFYRVAEEGLENAAKHSGAKNVSVRLDFKKGLVALTIQDDGVGMDPKTIKGEGKLGLISMEERARSENGNLTITSQPGHGTQISLEVPLPVDN